MNFKRLVKLFLSIGMLGLVLRVVNFSTLAATVQSISATCVITVIFGYILGQLLSAYKWFLILQSIKIETTYLGTLRAYWIGMFVNCFGPGTVGGDVARGLLVSQTSGTKTLALSSVVADRVHGLTVLACIGIISVISFNTQNVDPLIIWLLYFLIAISLFAWFLLPQIIPLLLNISKQRDTKTGALLVSVMSAFPKNPSLLIKITFVSTLFHLLQISLHAVMAYYLSLKLSISVLLSTIPFVNILSALPISWQGLGVRENGYVFFLSEYISKEQALAFGAIWLLAVTLSSAIGGIIAAITGELKLVSKKKTEFRDLNLKELNTVKNSSCDKASNESAASTYSI